LLDGKPIDYYVVKSPQFFMMGDNRDNSADSRYWGTVTLRNIRAKAFVIYFSFENEDQKFSMGNPFTWWRIPFRIRWTRIGKIIPLID
jgi:signal peptidase I